MTSTLYGPEASNGHSPPLDNDHRAPARRRPGKPAWVEMLENPYVRRLVAGQLEVRSDALGLEELAGASASAIADNDTSAMLLDLAEKLRREV